jgi:O-antigen/teichoic acid export membrane protein
MGVSLYTSRIVLQILGVDDFGVNVVVNSLIVMFLFINNSMSGASARFLTFELGTNNREKLKKTFSASMTVHIVIALLILVLGEIAGLWYLENKMVLPEGRMVAVRWVYHLALLNSVISVMQVPYTASIISHEKMDIYAYIEILSVCLRLLIVYLLLIGNFDKLILYAVLTLCVTFIMALIRGIYCIKHFEECRYKFSFDKTILYPILSYSTWNLLGNMGYSFSKQGINVILNLFFGVVLNAACGIATQVGQAIGVFSMDFLTAVKPQIIKYYAKNEIREMENLMINATKYSFILLVILSLPIVLEIDFILDIWLGSVPEYANIFCQLFIAILFVDILRMNLVFGIAATGEMKNINIVAGIIGLSAPIIAYVLLLFVRNVYIPMITTICIYMITFFVTLFILKSLIKTFSIMRFLKQVFSPCLAILLLSSILPLLIHLSLKEGWLKLILVVLSTITVVAVLTYYLALSKEMREKSLIRIKSAVFGYKRFI